MTGINFYDEIKNYFHFYPNVNHFINKLKISCKNFYIFFFFFDEIITHNKIDSIDFNILQFHIFNF